MCGIFGYIHRDIIPNIERIDTDAILQHRGPDDTGWLTYDGTNVIRGKSRLSNSPAKVLLLHKRLSIIDLTDCAWQPMNCANSRYYIIFNGEIYNYLELRSELEALGVTFTSKSDSEVLLKAYMQWGKSCLKKLIGMFAFVIFDSFLKKIFIARDAFGIKPFYYFVDDNKILFGSEIKSILHLLSKNKINSERLFFYLRSGLTDFKDQTLFSGVQQLAPGHSFEIDVNNFTINSPQPFWQAKINLNNDITFSEAAETLKNLFLKSLSLHLRSDVKVAATLSGGIDSSSIVMGIRNLYPDLDINTYSYIADQHQLSEEKWIDIVNTSAAAKAHKVYANPNNLISDLEELITIQDEPFGSTSIYAQHRVFQVASRDGIKVMLDGQGADEMLGGYMFYVAARFVSLLKQFKFSEAMQVIRGAGNVNRSLALSLQYLLPTSLQTPLRKLSGSDYIPSWLNAEWFNKNNNTLTPLKTNYGKNVLHEELLHTFTQSSLPMLLRYEDRNSMAYSIESRVPFLTTEIVDFIFSLPENFIISNDGLTKAVFREAMRGIVPQVILDRRDKIGFATPEKNWLATIQPWAEKVLMSDYAKQLPMFNHKKLISDWHQMLQGSGRFDFRFWRWINFIKWSELHQIDVT